MNWENLKYLLGFYRAGSLAGAAKRLHVDATTVSRRLSGLQSDAGVALIEKSSDGTLALTVAGLNAIQHAERVETALQDLHLDLSGERSVEEGPVRISSVPAMVNKILLPRMKDFAIAHPGIDLHLASEARNVSLTRREADMAVRLGRPEAGGYNVKAKRIAVLKHAVYGPADARTTDLPWVRYHEDMGFLPQARWMAENIDTAASRTANVYPNDLEGVIEAVAAGLGKSVLPDVIADADQRLAKYAEPRPELLREVWLLQHADQVGLARMTAVSIWLERLFSSREADRK